MTELLNKALTEGKYDNLPLNMETDLTIKMVEVMLEKTASHEYWGSGPLTYTVTVANEEPAGAPPYIDVVLKDTLEYQKVDLVAGSVQIDGVPVPPAPAPGGYTYDPATGLLTVPVGTVAAQTSKEVTFQVTKKP